MSAKIFLYHGIRALIRAKEIFRIIDKSGGKLVDKMRAFWGGG
jgi:hypothetical protein